MWTRLKPGPKDTVLDVACGSGLVVCAFAPYAGKIAGIDMTPAMLDRAVSLRRIKACAMSTGVAATYTYCRMPLRVSLLWSHVIHFIICSILGRHFERWQSCAAKGRIVVVDAYAPENSDQAAEFNRIEQLRDPSHASSLSLSALN